MLENFKKRKIDEFITEFAEREISDLDGMLTAELKEDLDIEELVNFIGNIIEEVERASNNTDKEPIYRESTFANGWNERKTQFEDNLNNPKI